MVVRVTIKSKRSRLRFVRFISLDKNDTCWWGWRLVNCVFSPMIPTIYGNVCIGNYANWAFSSHRDASPSVSLCPPASPPPTFLFSSSTVITTILYFIFLPLCIYTVSVCVDGPFAAYLCPDLGVFRGAAGRVPQGRVRRFCIFGSGLIGSALLFAPGIASRGAFGSGFCTEPTIARSGGERTGEWRCWRRPPSLSIMRCEAAAVLRVILFPCVFHWPASALVPLFFSFFFFFLLSPSSLHLPSLTSVTPPPPIPPALPSPLLCQPQLPSSCIRFSCGICTLSHRAMCALPCVCVRICSLKGGGAVLAQVGIFVSLPFFFWFSLCLCGVCRCVPVCIV